MFDGYDALVALAKHQSMGRAAVSLGITQSSVSKRITAFEKLLGQKLTEPAGRYVTLTGYAQKLLREAGPLLEELRSITRSEVAEHKGELSFAIPTAIIASWGAELMYLLQQKSRNLCIKLHVDSGRNTVENVRSGRCSFGIIRGTGESAPALQSELLFKEPLVLIPSGLKKFSWVENTTIPLLGVESSAESHRILARKLARFGKKTGVISPFPVIIIAGTL